MKMTSALTLLSLCIASTSIAQDMKVTEKVLPNGLKILLKEDHKSPVVTFQIWYRVGSRNECLGKTGLSHLLEHMMFKGTEKYGIKQFSQTVQRNGGNDNAFTSRDYTAYFENFAADRIEVALNLESDRMQNLLLDPKEFLSERDVVKEERRMRYEDDPFRYTEEQWMTAAFFAYPYQWPVIGWMADINNITRDDLYKHYQTYYTPNNATIIAVGDFDTGKLLDLITKYFGKLQRRQDVPIVGAVEPEQHGERRVNVKRPSEIAAVLAGYKTPTIMHHDSYALEVLHGILVSGKSSRLYRSLVYEKQLALHVGGDYDNVSIGPGLFYLYAKVMPGKTTGDVERALYAEIDKLKKTPPTDIEIQKAKNQIEATFILGQDSIFYQALLLGQFESAASWRILETYVKKIREVRKEDIERVANEYLSEDNRIVGVLIPAKNK